MGKPITLPLVGMPNPRGADVTAALAASKDQLFINCLFEKVTNPVTGNTFIGVDKRPGVGPSFTASGATGGVDTLNWIGTPSATYSNLHLFKDGVVSNRLYYGITAFTLMAVYTASAGAMTSMTEHYVNMVSTIMFTSPTKAYYTQALAITTANTFTADTTSGLSTLANVSSTTGLLHGQSITGTGIPASTYLSIVGAAVSLMDSAGVAVNATATNATVTMTRTIIALIVSQGYPGNATLGKTMVGKFASMNGFLFIMDNQGNVWNSDLNSVTGWTATSFINASEIPDGGVGCVRMGDTICAAGTRSFEFFQNSGSPTGTILKRVGTPTDVGCSTAEAIIDYDDTLYWVGRREKDAFGVYVLEGFVPKKISPSYVDADITQVGQTAALRIARFDYGGHPILAVTSAYGSVTLTRTWIFQMDVGIWGQWNNENKVGGIGAHWGLVSRDTTTAFKDRLVHISILDALGYLTDFGTPVYTDAGGALTRTIRTRVLDFGTAARKFLSALRLIGSKMTSAHSITMTYSDDDYATQSAAVTFDMTQAAPKVTRLGSFNRRSFTFTDAAAANCRLEYMEVPEDMMTVGSP